MGTIVFVMGVKTIRQNMDSLMKAGKDPETPVAVIRWGTLPRQKTILGKVKDIAETIENTNLMPPAVIVVGQGVKLHEKLKWFESKSLFGKRILVTRAKAQASELSQGLADLGAEVIEIPTIEIFPPPSWKEVDQALRKIRSYDWVLFASVYGVRSFLDRLRALDLDIRNEAGPRLGAVGPSTAKALEGNGLKVEVIPESFTGKDLAACFPRRAISGKKILIPCAKEGGEDLIQDLKSKGASVHPLTVYVNRPPRDAKAKLKNLAKERPLDLITFTSSSTVKNLVQLLGPSLKDVFLKIPSICMGPITEGTARQLGFERILVSKKATLEHLKKKILEFFSAQSGV
jgi:uroporphyrinogen III methyltransferase/synthase